MIHFLTLTRRLAKVVQTIKIISLVILIGTVGLIYLTLNLLSQKPKGSLQITSTDAPPASPSTAPDTNLLNLTNRIKIYNQKLEKQTNYLQKLTKPIVDLDISFEK